MIKVVWSKQNREDAYSSPYAIDEYFRSDFQIIARNRRSTKVHHHTALKNVILKMIAHFPRDEFIKHRDMKQEIFFVGHRRQAANLLAAFLNFRCTIRRIIDVFADRLADETKGLPYQQLRHETGLRCHRYKSLEKSKFQYLKDSDQERIVEVRENLHEIMKAYSSHLQYLDEQKVVYVQPEKGKLLTDRLLYDELSKVDDIQLVDNDIDHIKEIGFQDGYSVKDHWFDKYKFKN